MTRTLAVTGRGQARTSVAILILLALSVALNLALVVGVVKLSRENPAPAASGFDRGSFYAVFLNNRDAFVGHITAIGTDIEMQDVYYLTFQANDASGKAIPNPKPEDFKPVLCKLGSKACQQVYGPKDFVRINRQNVEYYTALTPDSQVVQAIGQYEKPQAQPSPKK